jgi:hypothetical protein
MTSNDLPSNVLRWDRTEYRGKHYELPVFDTRDPVVIVAHPERAATPRSLDERVVAGIHGEFDIAELLRPRRPASLGVLDADELAAFTRPHAPRVLDMPIKFPDVVEYRLPRALAQFAGVVQRIASSTSSTSSTRTTPTTTRTSRSIKVASNRLSCSARRRVTSTASRARAGIRAAARTTRTPCRTCCRPLTTCSRSTCARSTSAFTTSSGR